VSGIHTGEHVAHSNNDVPARTRPPVGPQRGLVCGVLCLLAIVAIFTIGGNDPTENRLGSPSALRRPPHITSMKSINWSGYTWNVRAPGTGGPGPNYWSDSLQNVDVVNGELLLAFAKNGPSGEWSSVELDCAKSLGYGTYRWVVNSRLDTLDAHTVLGMFTYDGSAGPSHNEIDIEPSHWGNMAWDNGSVTLWQNADTGANQSKTFNYTANAPYVNQFTWEPGKIRWLITDATGKVLLDLTTTTGVPVHKNEVPIINLWRFNNVAPADVIRVRMGSFTFTPLGQPPTPPTPSANTVAKSSILAALDELTAKVKGL
jgi:hypothetical protein